MPEGGRTHQALRMWGGLAALEKDESPTKDDWRVCSDAVNLLETLEEQGIIEDAEGLLPDAVAALAEAGKRSLKGHALRLSEEGIQTVRAVLESYVQCLNTLPARVMIRCHRQTEKRIQEMVRGKRRPHDVTVVAI